MDNREFLNDIFEIIEKHKNKIKPIDMSYIFISFIAGLGLKHAPNKESTLMLVQALEDAIEKIYSLDEGSET